MATRSTIALEYPDGKVSQIYCHWDGYLEHVGRILAESYNTVEKIHELMSLGDLSALGNSLGNKQNFNKPEEDTCVAYGRDRDEIETEARTFKDFENYALRGQKEEYNYAFLDGSWFVKYGDKEFTDLGTLLKKN